MLGAVALPTSIDGSLDYLNVDFFRFSGEPNSYLVANLDGVEGDMWALSDPFLGLFDSNCNPHWSSSRADGDILGEELYWIIYFHTGGVQSNRVSNPLYVRCVK